MYRYTITDVSFLLHTIDLTTLLLPAPLHFESLYRTRPRESFMSSSVRVHRVYPARSSASVHCSSSCGLSDRDVVDLLSSGTAYFASRKADNDRIMEKHDAPRRGNAHSDLRRRKFWSQKIHVYTYTYIYILRAIYISRRNDLVALVVLFFASGACEDSATSNSIKAHAGSRTVFFAL